ncbi:MAG: putative metal-binding protein (DUF2387) [halophilic archaeon J07HB67]|nr:MAG: putative metal-binding protein (DUF2387) [halophilic archaeon J07HB67]
MDNPFVCPRCDHPITTWQHDGETYQRCLSCGFKNTTADETD